MMFYYLNLSLIYYQRISLLSLLLVYFSKQRAAALEVVAVVSDAALEIAMPLNLAHLDLS